LGCKTNVVGRMVVRLRVMRQWTQEELAGKLQILGFPMTRNRLANIEIGRTPVKEDLILYLAHVFQVEAGALFPCRVKFRCVGVTDEMFQRRRRKRCGKKHRAR